jgi:hypothetical protein
MGRMSVGIYRAIGQATTVIPDFAESIHDPEHGKGKMNMEWGPSTLGEDSVVFIESEQKIGPLIPEHELYVKWTDLVGRKIYGWISKDIPFYRPDAKALKLVASTGQDLSALDTLRFAIWSWKRQLTPDEWARKFAKQYMRTWIRFCKELRLRLKSSDNPFRVGLSQFTGGSMKTAKKKVATPNATKVTAKKAKSNGEGRTKTLDRSTGALCVEALAKAPGRNKLLPIAQRLANGEVLGKSELTKLRDGINASAAEARASNKPKTAAALANANRQVRRLWRRA